MAGLNDSLGMLDSHFSTKKTKQKILKGFGNLFLLDKTDIDMV